MTKISLAIVIALVIMAALNWMANFIFRDAYPDKLAVDVPGFEALLVDRAALQRSWPEGLDDLRVRGQLRAHMREVENLKVPKTVASLTLETAAPKPEPDLATMLATADAASGERRARVCAACHTFNDGGRDGIGPNLWSILERDIGAGTPYNYSNALANEPGTWTFEKIDAYLLSPSKAIPGNKMAFQGVRRARDRADIIAFLRMQGGAEIPLPEPAPARNGETGQDAGE